MSRVDDLQLEVALACFDGHRRAGKIHRGLGRRIKGHGGTLVDEVVVRVNHKGVVRVDDPRRVIVGTLIPALTWGVFGFLASGGWSGVVVWGVIGAVCGGLYAYYSEHLLKKTDLKRLGTRLKPDSSALLVFVHGTDAKQLLDDVAAEDPRLASVATIKADLSATVATGAQHPDDASSAPGGNDTTNRSLLNMVVFRYSGRDSAKRVNERATAAQAKTKHPTVETELLVLTDKVGGYHVVSPSAGVRAFVPSDVIGWAAFGAVYGGIVGLAGNGSVLGLAEGAAVTGILWAIFGLVAGTLYAMFAGRAVSAYRFNALRLLLPIDSSIALCWVDGPLSDDSIAEWSKTASDQLILKFKPVAGGATLEVGTAAASAASE
jgi:uncharacterized membrane protein